MRWWRDLLGLQPERPLTRLDEAQAIAIAERALAGLDQPFDPLPPLTVHAVTQAGEDVEWLIATATRGAGATVRISDRTGQVLDARRHGVR